MDWAANKYPGLGSAKFRCVKILMAAADAPAGAAHDPTELLDVEVHELACAGAQQASPAAPPVTNTSTSPSTTTLSPRPPTARQQNQLLGSYI